MSQHKRSRFSQSFEFQFGFIIGPTKSVISSQISSQVEDQSAGLKLSTYQSQFPIFLKNVI